MPMKPTMMHGGMRAGQALFLMVILAAIGSGSGREMKAPRKRQLRGEGLIRGAPASGAALEGKAEGELAAHVCTRFVLQAKQSSWTWSSRMARQAGERRWGASCQGQHVSSPIGGNGGGCRVTVRGASCPRHLSLWPAAHTLRVVLLLRENPEGFRGGANGATHLLSACSS